jgi:hypothetical protein
MSLFQVPLKSTVSVLAACALAGIRRHARRIKTNPIVNTDSFFILSLFEFSFSSYFYHPQPQLQFGTVILLLIHLIQNCG